MEPSKKHTFTKEQLNIPDDGLIHLHDLSFDFEDYFERYEKREMDEDEASEYNARVMGLFCKALWESGGDTRAIPPWVADHLAKKFYESLGGVPWGDLMGLPWDQKTPVFTKKGQRAFDIYAYIQNTLKSQPDANVTDLLAEAAKQLNISYETARADYYSMKNALSTDPASMPENFLNKMDNF